MMGDGARAGHGGANAGALPRPGVLVIAVGNRSRGDDALGPQLLDRLRGWLATAKRGTDFELIEDFQLQIDHALDLEGRRLALFVDAGTGTPAPCTFAAVAVGSPGASHSTHALAPDAVLGVYRQINGAEPPPAFVLCVRGENFELGEDLSESARANVELAWRMLVALCERPDPAHWRECAVRGARVRQAEDIAAAP